MYLNNNPTTLRRKSSCFSSEKKEKHQVPRVLLEDLGDTRRSNFIFEFGGLGNLSDRSTTSATDNHGSDEGEGSSQKMQSLQ